MSAVAVGVQVLERAMIGGERMLVACDNTHNQIAREMYYVVQEIAHTDVVRRLGNSIRFHIRFMTWSPQDIMMGLYIAVAVMLIVVLYHVIFIVVDARKIARRISDLTEEVEAVIMKPLSMADQLLQWLVEFVQEKAEKHKK